MPVEPSRVRDLFLATLDLRPDQRPGYLADACGGDAELRAEVDRLLAAHADPDGTHEPPSSQPPEATGAIVAAGGGTVDLPPDTSPTRTFGLDAHRPKFVTTGDFAPDGAAGAVAREGRSTPTALGTVIAGRYTLVGVIGEGGMGTVYLASQTEPVRRQVAVKLIRAGLDSKAVQARFDAERQALALMDHPKIARIFDGGVTDRGQPFFVMELVRGVPLTEYCDSKRLSVPARLELFVSVCQAVQHAHQKGVIHRDLKPGNVLVTEVDGKPTPKVIDFGVAKATEQKLTDMSFSDVGAIVGTPAYMSPEQADPSSMDIDTRTDVYALGVILYELLVGSPPIDAKQFQRGAILEMLRMVREVEPPRPSTRLSASDALPSIAASRGIEPARLARLLHGELDWVVMKAIEKDRGRRYDTANGLARDVQRYLADEVVEARPPSRGYRLWKFVRRNRGQVLAAAAVLLALVAGVVGTGYGLLRASRANAELNAKNEALEAERAKVEQRFDMARKAIAAFHTTITAQPELEDEAFRPLRKKLLTSAAQFYRELEGLLANEPDARSRAALAGGYEQLADLTMQIGDKPEALALYRKALAIRRELAAATGADVTARLAVSTTLWNMGVLLDEGAGDRAAALRAFEEARDAAAALEAEASTAAVRKALASSTNSIGVMRLQAGELTEALVLYERARDIRQALAGTNPDSADFQFDLSNSHFNVGQCLGRMGRPAEALASLGEARDIRQKLCDKYNGDDKFKRLLSTSHMYIAIVLDRAGRSDEALAEYRKALTIREKLVQAHPAVTQYQSDLATCQGNIGVVLSRAGHPAEALASFERARDSFQKLVDVHPAVPGHQRSLAFATMHTGTMLARLGRLPEAFAAHEAALTLAKRLAEADPKATLNSVLLGSAHYHLGWARVRAGRPGEAAADLRTAVERLDAVPALDSDVRYLKAVALALLAKLGADPASGVSAAEAGGFADRAVATLADAVKAGWGPTQADNLAEPNFDAIRDRPDFKKLQDALESKPPPGGVTVPGR